MNFSIEYEQLKVKKKNIEQKLETTFVNFTKI